MNMATVLLVEDNAIEQIKIKKILIELGYTNITCVSSVEKAKQTINTTNPTLLIADVFLTGETSLDLVKEAFIPTIFITTSKDISLYNSLREKHKYAYLIKPIESATLYSTINLLLSKPTETTNVHTDLTEDNALLIRQGKKQVRILFSSILWLESEGNYTFIITKSGKYVIKRSLHRTAEELTANFVQIHRKYFVNIKHLSQLKADSILINEHEFPVTKKFKKIFKKIFLASIDKVIKD